MTICVIRLENRWRQDSVTKKNLVTSLGVLWKSLRSSLRQVFLGPKRRAFDGDFPSLAHTVKESVGSGAHHGGRRLV